MADHFSHTKIYWQGQAPFSNKFNDIYYSDTNGQAESQHVFLKANHMEHRLASRNPDDCFRVLELGFGTGLNFFNTVRLQLDSTDHLKKHHCQLEYFSCELYPLPLPEIEKAMGVFPDLVELIREFKLLYAIKQGQWLQVEFPQWQVKLSLAFMDANEMLVDLLSLHQSIDNRSPISPSPAPRQGIDAIYLDGFTPARNPEMWCSELFKKLAQLAGPGCTLSSFTAAGQVRRDLIAAGFTVQKVPGFGKKREMIQAIYPGNSFMGTP